ncbi:MAG TPA: acetyl-CoA carboxylase carboxyl transferase subunit beta, partial [Sphaerochaeta sp.]|nr:acetyl-CoA carboxylase carboxyl transferase subunit beta [Sphaerochaeta sp.]
MVELCSNCQKEVESGPYRICPSCTYYFPLTVQQRIALFADPGS